MRKLRAWAACGLLCVCVGLLSVGLDAQSFQGGLRGVVKDPQGVIPGATVTLVNESERRLARDRHQRRRRIFVPRHRTVDLYRPRVRSGLQDLRTQGRPHRHAGVHRPRHPARSRRPRGNDHRHRRIAADRHDQRLDRRRARHQVARVDPDAGTQRVPDGQPAADGADQRQRALEPHAGSGRQLRGLDGRRSGPRQPVSGRRLPGHRPAEPRLDQPDDRSDPGHEGPGPHLRRGDGPHRRRRDEHDREVRRQRVPRLRLHRVPPREVRRSSC